MGKYFAVGKQVLYEGTGGTDIDLHVADAANNEVAHAIATTFNQRSENFIKDALRTCSPNFYGERVSKRNFVHILNDCINAANQLDKVKKSLFYGRDNNLDPAEGQRNVSDLPDILAGNGPETQVAINIIHGILGKFTEAGELLEALKSALNDKDEHGFDYVNLLEEIGDGFWYDAILLNELDSTFEEVQERIIAKLRARFPDKYEDASANERNLDAERAILEGKPLDVRIGEVSFDPSFPTAEFQGFNQDILHNDPTDGLPNASETYPEALESLRDTEDAEYREALESLSNKPLIAPSVPASGPEAVSKAAESAKAAFANIEAAQANVGKFEVPYTGDNPEFAKAAGERLKPMDFEGIAQASGKAIEKAAKDAEEK